MPPFEIKALGEIAVRCGDIDVMEGWYRGTLDAGRRILLLVASILLLYPPTHELLGIGGWSLSAIGAILASIVILPRMLEARRTAQGIPQ